MEVERPGPGCKGVSRLGVWTARKRHRPGGPARKGNQEENEERWKDERGRIGTGDSAENQDGEEEPTHRPLS